MKAVPFALLAVLIAFSAQAATQPPSPPEPPPSAPQTMVLVVCKVVDLTGQPGRHGVDPVTGEYNEKLAARGWRDLELYVNPRTLEHECKTIPLPLEDAVAQYWPRKPIKAEGIPPHTNGLDMKKQAPVTGELYAEPLNANFGIPSQCGHAGMMVTPEWEDQNKGWGVVTVGCPTMIGVDGDGDGQPDIHKDGPYRGQYIVKGWKLPGCPTFRPGTFNFETGEGERMLCRFDASAV
jgi:hypothetical protein